ncbi:Broadcomplex core protein isoform, partial [Caligus rogercresseyi]
WRCMQPRICNYCWKTFSNSFNLKQHIVNVHVQSQGVVKNKWYLRKHLVTAHGAPLKRVKGSDKAAPPSSKSSPPNNNNNVDDEGSHPKKETLLSDTEEEDSGPPHNENSDSNKSLEVN